MVSYAHPNYWMDVKHLTKGTKELDNLVTVRHIMLIIRVL
jgi:hypothetical protein